MNVRENARLLKEKCAKMPEVDYLDRPLSGLTGLAGKTRNSSLEWLKCWNCKADFPAVFFLALSWNAADSGDSILFTPSLVQNAYSCVK